MFEKFAEVWLAGSARSAGSTESGYGSIIDTYRFLFPGCGKEARARYKKSMANEGPSQSGRQC